MERETISFESASGNTKAEIYSYASRRVKKAIATALFGDMKITPKSSSKEKPEMGSFLMRNTDEAENVAVEMMVKSLNGSSENVLERYLDLPDAEALELKEKIDSITDGESKKEADEKKAGGAGSTTGS